MVQQADIARAGKCIKRLLQIPHAGGCNIRHRGKRGATVVCILADRVGQVSSVNTIVLLLWCTWVERWRGERTAVSSNQLFQPLLPGVVNGLPLTRLWKELLLMALFSLLLLMIISLAYNFFIIKFTKMVKVCIFSDSDDSMFSFSVNIAIFIQKTKAEPLSRESRRLGPSSGGRWESGGQPPANSWHQQENILKVVVLFWTGRNIEW